VLNLKGCDLDGLNSDPLQSWRRTHLAREVSPSLDGSTVTIFGWVESVRDLGGINFIIVQDRSGKVQVTLPHGKANSGLTKRFTRIQKQFVVAIRGRVRAEKRAPSGAEILPTDIRILNESIQQLPLDPTGKVPVDLDTRLESRVLDLRRPIPQAIFQVRNILIKSIRDFLCSQGYFEVSTPKIIATATEGGAELFPIAYYDREAFLAQSPQLYKEELTLAFEKVFEIAPYFRAEESHTVRHLSEFISVDLEEAFVDSGDVSQTLQDLILHSARSIQEQCPNQLKTLGVDSSSWEEEMHSYTYDEILEELDQTLDMPLEWGEDISTAHLRALSDIHPGFYFICDWPSKTKPFYINPSQKRPEVTESFDLMHGWVELASGGTRVASKEVLIKRLEEQGLNPLTFKHHLKAYDYGMPPHAGWGLGFDRLLMVFTGRENIREVVLFPRDQSRLTP
jgi:aspartyl-tRNA synthetase